MNMEVDSHPWCTAMSAFTSFTLSLSLANNAADTKNKIGSICEKSVTCHPVRVRATCNWDVTNPHQLATEALDPTCLAPKTLDPTKEAGATGNQQLCSWP